MGRRAKIRLAGCVVALVLIGSLFIGTMVARTGDPVLMYVYWVGCAFLLLSLLGLAVLDVLETVRMAKKARIDMIVKTMAPRDRDEP